jgi:hypothetical protein
MIGESYELTSIPSRMAFQFHSQGARGNILKEVLYQPVADNTFNLAFGDVVDGELIDEVVSNNLDFVRVMNSVAKTIYEFTEMFPEAIIQFEGVDGKRLRFSTGL